MNVVGMSSSLLYGTAPDVEEVKGKEWLVANGLGGYASSTISGLNTRRYHGILVASFNPPTVRKVLVSKVEETLFGDFGEIAVSTNQYPGTFYPQGYKALKKFERDPLPQSVFQVEGLELTKTVFMVYGSNTTLVEYRNTSDQTFNLRLNPLYVDRDYHGLFREDPYYDYFMTEEDDYYKINAHYGSPPLYFKFSKGSFIENRNWNKNVEYSVEAQRGLDFTEDAYSIGFVECKLLPNEAVYLAFSLDPSILKQPLKQLKQQELKRLKKLVPKIENKFHQDLVIAADQFVVKRKSTDSYTILAGYPWFTDWGRDTMISLRGLCIDLGRKKEAKSIINTFLKYLDQGILPNRFPDYDGEPPEYNTVDATLWLFVAIYEYDIKFNDLSFVRSVLAQLKEVLQYHINGTRYNIKVNEEGLLSAGQPGVQLTWMDAKVGDYVVTPREGFAVEINALWYNALKVFEFLSNRIDQPINPEYKKLATKLRRNFRKYFWNKKGYLNDVIDFNKVVDTAIRPNQIYAVSLPFTLLNAKEQKSIVENVRKHLLTGYGLRSLSKMHHDFRATYGGNPWSRDTAYHQGTVWTFLIAEYFLAYLKINRYSQKAKNEVEQQLSALEEHFYQDACIHGVSEVFDGGDPKHGKGCINQAWSVAALIRIIIKTGLLKVK